MPVTPSASDRELSSTCWAYWATRWWREWREGKKGILKTPERLGTAELRFDRSDSGSEEIACTSIAWSLKAAVGDGARGRGSERKGRCCWASNWSWIRLRSGSATEWSSYRLYSSAVSYQERCSMGKRGEKWNSVNSPNQQPQVSRDHDPATWKWHSELITEQPSDLLSLLSE